MQSHMPPDTPLIPVTSVLNIQWRDCPLGIFPQFHTTFCFLKGRNFSAPICQEECFPSARLIHTAQKIPLAWTRVNSWLSGVFLFLNDLFLTMRTGSQLSKPFWHPSSVILPWKKSAGSQGRPVSHRCPSSQKRMNQPAVSRNCFSPALPSPAAV